MERVYNPKEIEQKWQKIWDDEKAFAASERNRCNGRNIYSIQTYKAGGT